MNYEHIIKREDKSSVKIVVSLRIDSYTGRKPEYKVDVYHKAPRKRTWIGFDTNDYKWRSIPFGSEERKAYEDAWMYQYVTPEEVAEAKRLCWLSFEP